MPHMQPEIVEGKWYMIETSSGDTTYVPFDVIGTIKDFGVLADDEPMFAAWVAPKLRDYCEDEPQRAEIIDGWGARLSAPGFLDCTDWMICASQEEAKRELAEQYELCHVCLSEVNCSEDFACPKGCPQ